MRRGRKWRQGGRPRERRWLPLPAAACPCLPLVPLPAAAAGAMAERIEQRLEDRVPELEQLERVGLFTHKEIK